MDARADRQAEFEALLEKLSNWGRWGEDDQRGAVNLITPAKRVEAAALVRTGQAVSLSRPFPKAPAANNPRPAQHFVKSAEVNGGYTAGIDYYGIQPHGLVCTHVDALCHVWSKQGMWNGRAAEDYFDTDGSRWGDIAQWADGIVTRGVLIDIPRLRGGECVTYDKPVTAEDLRTAVERQNVEVRPGDALLIYCGRDMYDANNPPWGTEQRRPGLHASCVTFFAEADCAAIAWDMQDHAPNDIGMSLTVHLALFKLGMAVVDHCEFGELSRVCASEGRYDFMFSALPLVVSGGTGSPVNPVAIF
jgi:kynurenine formamidase